MNYVTCESCGSTAGHCPHYPAAARGFAARVKLAATCLLSNSGIGSRGYDNCFEMGDGDAVVVALDRMADDDWLLRDAINREWSSEAGREGWNSCCARYRHIPTDRLDRLAMEIRARSDREWAEQLAGVRQLALAL